MSRQLNWAVVGTGWIANEMAQSFAASGRRLFGAVNRTYSKGEKFAMKYCIDRLYRFYEELLADPEVDIVYVATPHNTHFQIIKDALKNGKHVLSEKSITLNSTELEECIALAEEKKLVLAEAQTIYHMPVYKKLWAMKDAGKFGKVQVITANFGSFKTYDMENRFFDLAKGGGALLDIGSYAFSAVLSFLDGEPCKVLSVNTPSPAGSDEMSAIALATESGQVATVALSMHSKQPKRIMISCEKGYLEIQNYPRAEKAFFTDAVSGETNQISAGNSKLALMYEVEDMENAVQSGDASAMKLGLTRSVMKVMTDLRREWGLKYPEEEKEERK
ncbi:MAG: Gfo/Idh/MocA family oxidoreductase [Firmicutes bacterium]|nr:Gfo/Idh/MocA family oxidoreductase [Bacillota bacterium]